TQGEFDVRVASSGQLVTTIGSTRCIPPPWRSAHKGRSPGGSAESDPHPCRRGLDRQSDAREDRATAYPFELTKGKLFGDRPSLAAGRASPCKVARQPSGSNHGRDLPVSAPSERNRGCASGFFTLSKKMGRSFALFVQIVVRPPPFAPLPAVVRVRSR